MVKPRGKIYRSNRPQRVNEFIFDVDPQRGIEIGAWCNNDEGQNPEQVHLRLHTTILPWPVTIRFKSPDTLGFLIEELNSYRHTVWPNAEPVNLEQGEEGDPS